MGNVYAKLDIIMMQQTNSVKNVIFHVLLVLMEIIVTLVVLFEQEVEVQANAHVLPNIIVVILLINVMNAIIHVVLVLKQIYVQPAILPKIGNLTQIMSFVSAKINFITVERIKLV